MSKRSKYMIIVIMILGLICIFTYGYSFARYASNSVWNYYLESKKFYFSSDELDTIKSVNVNNNWDNGSVYFSIRNSLNDFLISDYDISYNVSCTITSEEKDYSNCLINGSNSSSYSGILSSSYVCDGDSNIHSKSDCESNGYNYVLQENYKDLYFDVVSLNGEKIDNVDVLVEVTTSKPYKKTLLGEFKLSSALTYSNGLGVSYNELDNYSSVIVSNSYDEDKCVSLSWNSDNLRIDYTDIDIVSMENDDNGYVNSIKFNIGNKDSISYRFYKTDFDGSYSENDFNLIEVNSCNQRLFVLLFEWRIV